MKIVRLKRIFSVVLAMMIILFTIPFQTAAAEIERYTSLGCYHPWLANGQSNFTYQNIYHCLCLTCYAVVNHKTDRITEEGHHCSKCNRTIPHTYNRSEPTGRFEASIDAWIRENPGVTHTHPPIIIPDGQPLYDAKGHKCRECGYVGKHVYSLNFSESVCYVRDCEFRCPHRFSSEPTPETEHLVDFHVCLDCERTLPHDFVRADFNKHVCTGCGAVALHTVTTTDTGHICTDCSFSFPHNYIPVIPSRHYCTYCSPAPESCLLNDPNNPGKCTLCGTTHVHIFTPGAPDMICDCGFRADDVRPNVYPPEIILTNYQFSSETPMRIRLGEGTDRADYVIFTSLGYIPNERLPLNIPFSANQTINFVIPGDLPKLTATFYKNGSVFKTQEILLSRRRYQTVTVLGNSGTVAIPHNSEGLPGGNKNDALVGSTVQITAANTSMRVFTHWTSSSDLVEFANPNSHQTRFVMPDSPVSIEAHFIDGYDLSVVKGYGGGVYVAEKEVLITANPGHTIPTYVGGKGTPVEAFAYWKISSGGEEYLDNFKDRYSPQTIFKMPAENVTLEAVCFPISEGHQRHTLTVIDGDGGGEYYEGDQVLLTAPDGFPEGEWWNLFNCWKIEGSVASYDNPWLFTMPDHDVTVTADIVGLGIILVDPSTLTIEGGNPGSVSFRNYSSSNIKAMDAPDGKVFHHWEQVSNLGFFQDTGNPETVYAPIRSGDATIRAVFVDADSPGEDTIPPIISSITPSGQMENSSGDMVITFNESMAGGNNVILDSPGGHSVLIPVSKGSWSRGNTVLTLPYSGLNWNTTYTVGFNEFKDLSGNSLKIIPGTTHSFKTIPMPMSNSVSPSSLVIPLNKTNSFNLNLAPGNSATISIQGVNPANPEIVLTDDLEDTIYESTTITVQGLGVIDQAIVNILFSNGNRALVIVSVIDPPPVNRNVKLNQVTGGTASAKSMLADAVSVEVGAPVLLSTALENDYSFVKWELSAPVKWMRGNETTANSIFVMPEENIEITPVYLYDDPSTPKLTSISTGTVTYLVSGSAANLNVDIKGKNLTGQQVIVSLKNADGVAVFESTPFSASDEFTARLSLSAAQMNLPDGIYTVEAALVGTDVKAETELEVISPSSILWKISLVKVTDSVVKAAIKLDSDPPAGAKLILAFYDEKGLLLSSVVSSDEVLYDDLDRVYLTADIPDGAVTIKGFYWGANLAPLCPAAQAPAN